VAGTALDLRQGRTLSSLFIDNAYWRREPGATAELRLAQLNKKILFSASDLFSHMIVYAPEGQPFVCVENLTTCPNAPNLVSAGFGEMANMLVATPGARVEGWVEYRLASLQD
jgi:galactose mutarotase-like enzyme